MCLKDETILPENSDVVYGWKVLNRGRDGKLNSFWAHQSRTYSPFVREEAVLGKSMDAGFYFYPNKKDAQVSRRNTAKWAAMQLYTRDLVIVFCRFEGILAKGLDNTSYDWPHAPAMRDKVMDMRGPQVLFAAASSVITLACLVLTIMRPSPIMFIALGSNAMVTGYIISSMNNR